MNCYIARKYCNVEIDLARAIYEEGVFSSYDAAYQHMLKICEDEHEDWLGEIVCCPLDCDDPDSHIKEWTFSTKGELLRTYDCSNPHEGKIKFVTEDGDIAYVREPDASRFTRKFQVGDFVYVKARPWNPHGYQADIIGVIGCTPVPLEQWLSEGKNKYEWEDDYVIYFIDFGYLNHGHVEEAGIQPYVDDLPERLSFLKRFSDHLSGKRPIEDDLLRDIYENKVFLEKVRHLPDTDSC